MCTIESTTFLQRNSVCFYVHVNYHPSYASIARVYIIYYTKPKLELKLIILQCVLVEEMWLDMPTAIVRTWPAGTCRSVS